MKEEKLDFNATVLLSLAGEEHSAPPLITGWRRYSRQSRPTVLTWGELHTHRGARSRFVMFTEILSEGFQHLLIIFILRKTEYT